METDSQSNHLPQQENGQAGSLSHGGNMNGVFRRRHLPHWDVEGHPVFITACLEGSISAAGLTQIREFREQLEERPKPTHVNDDD
jgi:type I restriction enzyme R subunit